MVAGYESLHCFSAHCFLAVDANILEGEAQLTISQLLPSLQDLVSFIKRCYQVFLQIVQQLVGFYALAKENSKSLSSSDLHLQVNGKCVFIVLSYLKLVGSSVCLMLLSDLSLASTSYILSASFAFHYIQFILSLCLLVLSIVQYPRDWQDKEKRPATFKKRVKQNHIHNHILSVCHKF